MNLLDKVTNYIFNNKIRKVVFCILLSFIFLLFFSSTTSPLTKDFYGVDSGFFILTGKMMKHGMLPYRDIFDFKGPYFFLLQEIGQIICEGKIGIFIIQVINLSISLLLVDRIISLKTNNKVFTVITYALVLFVTASTIQGGNLDVEYSLPFSLICLLLFVKYLDKKEEVITHNPFVAMIYGSIFSIFVFSRIVNSVFMCSIVLTIIIMLISRKQYANLLANALFFILGFSIVSFVICYYYYSNNLLTDMLNDVFKFGFTYASMIKPLDRMQSILDPKKLAYIVMSLIMLYIPFANPKCNKWKKLFSVLSFIFTLLSTSLGNVYLHYFFVIIPYIVWIMYLCCDYDINIIKTIIKNKLLMLLFIISLLIQTVLVGGYFIKTISLSFGGNTFIPSTLYKEEILCAKDSIKDIPEEDYCSIWGYGVRANYYLYLDIYPPIKYCDYFYHHLIYEDQRKDLIQLLNNKKPKWIIYKKGSMIIEEVEKFLSENYIEQEKRSNVMYAVYKLAENDN